LFTIHYRRNIWEGFKNRVSLSDNRSGFEWKVWRGPLFRKRPPRIPSNYAENRFSRRELLTTETELNAMASAAKTGFNRMPNAG